MPDIETLAHEFFRRFSRMEYALKKSGFCKGNEKRVDADWNRFANSIRGELETDPMLRNAVAYLTKHPPKKQCRMKNKLKWTLVPPHKHLTSELIECAKRVRNNLFHGGKFDGRRWFMPERDALLFRHSLVVLEGCLRASADVRRAWN